MRRAGRGGRTGLSCMYDTVWRPFYLHPRAWSASRIQTEAPTLPPKGLGKSSQMDFMRKSGLVAGWRAGVCRKLVETGDRDGENKAENSRVGERRREKA